MNIALPPLHPILVNFTAALVPASVMSDLLGRVLGRPTLSATGWWTMFYAAAITPFTALAGWWWLRSMPPMDAPEMSLHKFLGTALAVVLVAVAWWRWRAYKAGALPSRAYLIVAILAVSSVIVQGHVGGTMSFGSGGDAGVSSTPARDHHSENSSATPQWRDHIDVKD